MAIVENVNCICVIAYAVVICFSAVILGSNEDVFYEELYVKPLQNGYVSYNFQFTTLLNTSIDNKFGFTDHHYRIFPKSLGELLQFYDVDEMHLTLTQGKWRYQFWGYPVEDSPAGAQLLVWFKPSVADVDESWLKLVNTLSGLFCSSLNFLDAKSTVSPAWTFKPGGVSFDTYNSSSHMRYGALPNEAVCTENLTPWMKLLPCDSKAGLSTLFKGENLFNSNYHSLGVHFRPLCHENSDHPVSLELRQSLIFVTDIMLSNSGYPNWSLRKVFGHSLSSYCPLASRSEVFVDTSDNHIIEKFTLRPSPCKNIVVSEGNSTRTLSVYDIQQHLHTTKQLDVMATYSQHHLYGTSHLPTVYAHRYVTGIGLERGGIACLIYNNMDIPLPVIYMDTYPPFTRIFYKSVEVKSNRASVPFKAHFVPGRDHEKSYLLELSFILAPRSMTKVSLQYEKSFRKWTEYPPDANHGFYINSAVITVDSEQCNHHSSCRNNASTLIEILSSKESIMPCQIYTENLLVSAPTPDFSMPYNVICLACTVVAIAFGSIHNLTTRRFAPYDETAKASLVKKLQNVFKHIRGSCKV